MSRPLDEPLDAHGLGQLYQVVPLSGSLQTSTGEAEAVLCRTRRGLFIAPRRRGEPDPAAGIDVLAAERVTYELGVISDRIVVDGLSFGVPPRRGRAAREQVAMARLLPGRRRARRLPESVTVAPPSTVEAAWIDAQVQDDDDVLVWLPFDEPTSLQSALGPKTKSDLTLLLTERRALLVAVGPLGDADVTPLSRPLTVEAVDDSTVRIGERTLSVDGSAPLASRLVALANADLPERVLEVLRRNYLARKERPAFRARAALLARRLLERGDDLGTVVAFYLRSSLGLGEAPDGAQRDAALRHVIDTRQPDELTELWRSFELSIGAGMLLVERLRSMERGAAFSVPLHRAVRAEQQPDDHRGRATLDAELAEHLVQADKRQAARRVLEQRLESLPPPVVDDYLPEASPRLHEPRLRLLAAMADATDGAAHTRALVRLVQRDPLEAQHAQRLAEQGAGWGRRAASVVVDVLRPGGLVSDAEPAAAHTTVAHPPGPLELEEIESLRHPASRTKSALAAVQGYLAKAKVPDRSSLRAFCERLDGKAHPVAAAALADAVLALRVRTVDAFVSRGDKGVGVRAYHGQPAFLLVGGLHLDAGTEFTLDEAELRFAVASEVAHVKFEHVRMTPDEVWAGAWDKSKATLDAMLTLMPMFRQWERVEKLIKLATLTRTAVKQVDGTTRTALREESLGVRSEELVEAHRLMQLTADRAGLLLSGDLGASIRAMFKTDPILRAELPLGERHGLRTVLDRRDEGELFQPDLRIRASALISFYVSGTYPRLRRALLPDLAGTADDAE